MEVEAHVQMPVPQAPGAPQAPSAEKVAEGVAVMFTDLSYTVPLKKKKKKKKGAPPEEAELRILDGLSGSFLPSRLTALMGPSGSGKTTLMDVLAGRKSGAGTVAGEVLFGGAVAKKQVLRHLVGYVEQFDTLLGELTVEQMLMYTAELKLPQSMLKPLKQQRVDEVIAQLRLEKCRGTVIGNQLMRGISGGQAKRVNIALALVTRPTVLFLDEPTSGLDSKMANEVCLVLQSLAQKGCTVVATVHSPTSFAFSLFDDLLMMQGGGKVVYQGARKAAKGYFEENGHTMSVDVSDYSLPDWLTDLTSGGTEDLLETTDAGPDAGPAATDFAKLWAASEANKAASAEHSLRLARVRDQPATLPTTANPPSQLHALRTLLAYRMTTHYRSGEFLGPRIGDKVFMSVLTVTLYWGIGDKTDAGSIQSTAAVLYFFAALCGYGAAAFVPSLTLERALFYRERADGCYSPVTYYVSKFIEEAVLCVFTSLIFTLIVFFGMHLQGSLAVFALTYFLTTMVGIVLAYAVASVAPTMEAANALLPTYVTTCMYFGGLFLLFDKMPAGWKWYSWTSFLRYSWGALMLNQFDGTDTGDALAFWDEDAEMPINVLDFYGMGEDDGIMRELGSLLAVLGALCLFFASVGAMGITFVSHVKR